MPTRFAHLRGIAAPVFFLDGSQAGTLGRISDLGFEVDLQSGEGIVLLRFDCVEAVEGGRVLLNCDPISLGTCVLSASDGG